MNALKAVELELEKIFVVVRETDQLKVKQKVYGRIGQLCINSAI